MTDEQLDTEEYQWRDVERLLGDLDRDGYEVSGLRTNMNPVSGDKLVLIEVSESE